MGCMYGRIFSLISPGQVAQISAHGHDGPTHEDLVVGLVVHHQLQARRDGQQGLASARLAQQCDHLDRGIQQQFHGELLFAVAGLDAPGVGLHALQGPQEPFASHETGQSRVAGVGLIHQGEKLIGLEGQHGIGLKAAVVELIHLRGIHLP